MPVITDDEITRAPINLAKYDPYVDKIRALFVPSLEPRILSCLENFIYCEDPDRLCNYPCLKRCLEMAATLREPVDAFCSKWSDEGILENIISHGIRYLIKDGLVDCFINSIILNNRLNKVCRDLDGLRVERDLLRSSTVWNYINERDYWIENNSTIIRSESRESCDFIDRQSDLDVEIGSEFRDSRNNEVSKKWANCSQNKDSLDDNNERSRLQLENWLCGDSSISEKSKPTDRKRTAAIYHTFSRGTFNCHSASRLTNAQPSDWEGKILKFKLSGGNATNTTSDRSKLVQLSKLHLPCRPDDFISKFNKAESTSGLLSSISRKKKFQAGINNICRRINKKLMRISRNAVRKCRLHCEIFPSYWNFKITQKECNGCKVCLLNDRVLTSKIDYKNRVPSGELHQSAENEVSRESELTIYESALQDVEDKRISSSEPKVDSDPDYIVRHQKSKSRVQSSNELTSVINSSSFFNENRNQEQTCRCDTFYDSPDKVDDKNNVASVHPTESQADEKEVISKEAVHQESPLLLKHRRLEDRTRPRNESFLNTSHDSNCVAENKLEARKIPIENDPDNVESSTRKKSVLRTTGIDLENLECRCDDSSEHRFPTVFEKPSVSLVTRKFETAECFGNLQVEKPSHPDEKVESAVNEGGRMEPFVKSEENQSAFKNQDSVDSVVTLMSQNVDYCRNKGSEESMLRCCPENDCEAINDSSVPTGSKLDGNAPIADDREIQFNDVACECRLNCFTENVKDPGNKLVNRDTQCSRFSPRDEDHSLDCRVKESSIRDDSNRKLTIKDRINRNSEMKTNSFRNRENSRESGKVYEPESSHPFVPLKNVPTKVLSRSMYEKGMNAAKPCCPVPSSLQYLETNESKDKPFSKSPSILSSKFSRSKGQRINISIELSRETESSTETLIKNDSKNTTTMGGDPKKIGNFRSGESRGLSLLQESLCNSMDLGSREMRVNQPSKENTKDECPGGGRVHSRPLEFKDSLPIPERLVSRMRNSIVHENPIKSRLRPNETNDRRSAGQTRDSSRNLRDYEGKEFRGSIRNDRCLKRNNRDRLEFRRKDESTRSSRNSEKITGSLIGGHLCHAFSSTSIDKMRRLIKTKLRRILLDRDKSTNTPKTILTNKKYRVSVPSGKIEPPLFSRHHCRTIWESQSDSDSSRTSRSLCSENHTRIHDSEEICHVLYRSKKKSKISSSNFESISRNSDRSRNDSISIDSRRDDKTLQLNQADWTRNGPRLSGGSDFITGEKIIPTEERVPLEKQTFQPFIFENQSLRKDRCKFDIHDRKSEGPKVPREFHDSPRNLETFRNEKFDLPLDSTSRHIYLYGIVESSNDQLSGSRTSNETNSRSSKMLCSFKRHERRKPSTKNQKFPGKKYLSSSKHSSPKNSYIYHNPNKINISSFDTYSMSAPHKAFNHLDYDLRSKLSEYVTLCKNVKYSLLKRLCNGVVETGRTSLVCRHL